MPILFQSKGFTPEKKYIPEQNENGINRQVQNEWNPSRSEDLQQKTHNPSSLATTRTVKKGEKNRTECFCAYRIKINYSVVFFLSSVPLSTTTITPQRSGSEAKRGAISCGVMKTKLEKMLRNHHHHFVACRPLSNLIHRALILRSWNVVSGCMYVCISYSRFRSEKHGPQSSDMIFNGVL